MRARLRSIVLLPYCGIFHSSSTGALQRRLGQIDLDAVAGRLHVADVDQAGQRGRPQPGQRPAAGVQRQMIGAVEPPRRHHPAVVVVEVAFLRLGVGVLVPRVPSIHRVSQRIGLDEHLLVFPVVVVRTAQQDPDAEVDVDQRRGDELPVHDHAGRDEHLAAPPVLHVLVGEVAVLGGVLERPPSSQAACAAGPPGRNRAVPRRRSRTGRRAWARPSS